MNSESYVEFCEWLKNSETNKWKDEVVTSIIDGKIFCKCIHCPKGGSISKQGKSWNTGHFSRNHLDRQTMQCPDRKHVSELLSSSSSSSADQIMETDDVSSILS